MRIKPGMNWGWRVQIQFETNADVQGTATGGDRVAWYQSSLILACRMSQAVAWQHMVYVLHSLMLHCGPTWKGSWTCFLPLGCYHSQWTREIKRKKKKGRKKKELSWQRQCSDPSINQLPKFLFDLDFVCFVFLKVLWCDKPLFCCLHPDTVSRWKALFSSNTGWFVIVNLLCYSSLHEVIRPYSLLASTDVHQESFQRYDTLILK